MNDNEEMKCENCQHYKFIDSGYGDCVRYPPVYVLVQIGWLLKPRYRIEYPEVAWCNNICGEFVKREVVMDEEKNDLIAQVASRVIDERCDSGVLDMIEEMVREVLEKWTKEDLRAYLKNPEEDEDDDE